MSSFTLICVLVVNIFVQGLVSSLPEEYETQVKNYPDIIQSKEKCLPQQGNYEFASTLVCDPDGLLSVAQINMLNTKLHHIRTSVNFDKPSCDINNPRPVIGVAIVKKIEVDNMDKDRLLSYAAIFSYRLFDKWNLPSHCHSESGKIILLYSKDDGVLYTIAGNLLRRKITSKQIINIAIRSREQFSTSISDGIAYIIERYREAVESRSADLFDKAK
ncbi:unnamed protein product [Schistosoma margrebowiei]|uniref:TPM domain-containing protein n=1 Tax=Schistosoma margrebowiei TaxID=48269 RepID=A0AA85AIA8_9TREM|nr:unnamed protein product [Schistosoma margrebowiei]